MTKKQYFYALWAISSIGIVVTSVLIFLIISPTEQEVPLKLYMIVAVLLGVFVYGFCITMGLYFSQKIGARLLFLEGHFDWKKDIIKPAALVAVIYSVMAVLANLLLMKFFEGASDVEELPLLVERQNLLLGSSFSISMTGLLSAFSGMWIRISEVINADIVSLLFVLSGIALLEKKIFRDMSTSRAMLMAIAWVAIFASLKGIRVHGFSMLLIVSIIEMIRQVLLGLLFRKKGFETAVLCHILIVSIIYAASPLVVFALGA
jgi:hypothetical protein